MINVDEEKGKKEKIVAKEFVVEKILREELY